MKSDRSSKAILVVVALVALAAWVFRGQFADHLGAAPNSDLEGVEVERGPLRVSQVVRGNLKAKDSISLKSELEGNSTILFLADEGTVVKAGDLVAELDVSQLADKIVAQEIALQNARAAHTKAKEQYEIQEIQNATDVATAELDLTFAEIDQRKYVAKNGEYEHELAQAQETIVLREEALSQAKTKYEWTQKLFDSGFAQRTELDSDKFSVDRATIEWEQSVREKSLLADFEHDRRVAELEAGVQTKQRELEKTRKQAIARLTDFFADRASTEAKLGLELQKFDKLRQQIGKARLTAPEGGMVVYARERSRHMGSGEPMAEGKEVRERQEIVTIPREAGMIAEASLHETLLRKVAVGQECTITIDAISGRAFRGHIAHVAMLPDPNGWMSDPNQRVYRTEVALDETTVDMRPGMSCNIEILATELEDVTYVPVPSVYVDGGKPVCFVVNRGRIEKRAIEVGLDNTRQVEVKRGLEQGEFVLIKPPPDFVPSEVPPDNTSSGSG